MFLALLLAVPLAAAFSVPCNICWAVLNEVEGLLSENVTQVEITQVLENDVCAKLDGFAAAACDAVAAIGVPTLVNLLDNTAHVGEACQQLKVCDQPNPTHKDLWQVPVYVLDLDLPPQQRWTALFQTGTFKQNVLDVVNTVVQFLPAFIDVDVDLIGQQILKNLAPDYQAEIAGIAAAVGTKASYIALAQTAYDLTDCTSIVANAGSDVMHFRNLDFGAGLGFTDTLRDLLVHVKMQRNGTTIAHVKTFGGYVGVLTGMLPGKFSITINTRFEDVNPFVAWTKILQQFYGNPAAYMPAHLTRDTLLSANSYAAAAKMLMNTPILGRVYYTLGGVKAGEGRLIARNQNSVAHDVSIGNMPQATWFVLQTNYDWWNNTVPFVDNRRAAGINAMINNVGQNNVGMMTVIQNVLSVKPVLNQVTTVSVAMHVATGEFMLFGRYCNSPCPF